MTNDELVEPVWLCFVKKTREGVPKSGVFGATEGFWGWVGGFVLFVVGGSWFVSPFCGSGVMEARGEKKGAR
jgi:hypothetical protein